MECNVIRHLVLMRSWYLLSSSQSSLNVELLSRLGLTTSPCWTEEKLSSVQPFLTESLLYYWWDLLFTAFPPVNRDDFCEPQYSYIHLVNKHLHSSTYRFHGIERWIWNDNKPNWIESNLMHALYFSSLFLTVNIHGEYISLKISANFFTQLIP